MKKKGFTLVEMLLVIALIATITAVVIPNIVSSISEGKVRECESYVTLLEDNLEMYNKDMGNRLTFNSGIAAVSFDTLKSRVSEINIGDTGVNELKIKKNGSRFLYCAIITCDGNEYRSKTCW